MRNIVRGDHKSKWGMEVQHSFPEGSGESLGRFSSQGRTLRGVQEEDWAVRGQNGGRMELLQQSWEWRMICPIAVGRRSGQ